MQQKNQIFLDRSDTLAVKMTVNIGDLPEIIGISRATLFAYRAGKAVVSGKSWKKLEAAERKAGITPSIDEQLKKAATFDAKQQIFRDATLAEKIKLLPIEFASSLALGLFNTELCAYLQFSEAVAGAARELLKNPNSKTARLTIKQLAPDVQKKFQYLLNQWASIYAGLMPLLKSFKSESRND